MNALQKLSIITSVALVIAVTSAAYAEYTTVSATAGRFNWDAFGASIWITMLITIPSFLVFAMSGIVLLVRYIRSRKTKNQ
jgi:hypothetical protein